MAKIRFGFLEIIFEGDSPVPCKDELCNRSVGDGMKCFIDTWTTGDIYCSDCGKCERYSRKKATQRGEAVKPSY